MLLTRGTDRAMIEVVLEAIRMELESETGPLQQTAHGADFFRAAQLERVKKIAAIFALK